MQTAINTLTMINSVVLGVILIAILGTKQEIKQTEEFDSWWESDPNETKETPKKQGVAKGQKVYTFKVGRTKAAQKAAAARKEAAARVKKAGRQAVKPVRQAKRLKKSR